MTTDNDFSQDSATESLAIEQVGTLLKRQRESMGYTQKQVADRLRLRVNVIEQIDDNQLESGQVATFTRGYLRSYARLVGLDEKIILDALDNTGDAQHQEQEMQSFSRKTNTEKHNSRIMLITWGIFIIITGISSLWWWQNQQENSLAQSVNQAAQLENAVIEENEPPVLDDVVMQEMSMAEGDAQPEIATEVEVEPAQVETTESTPVEEAVESDAQAQLTPSVAEESLPLEAPKANGETALTMSFRSDCWVQVKDASGKTLISGIRKSGQDLNLSGQAPFNVILGAPEGVTMTFASEPVDLSRYTAGKVARFTLPL
ncbi:TPA: cytoskeleton protein RodZ [Vibrio vulnificus]|uniref:cytoskeleton protein RodZ n=1 Tax=Vibrio vulnificus TaxID=672 RepID=UPI001028D3A5|nr:cytoskeleton protein RodZ [Vibrio vulnificus]EIN9355408.1 cytoskeleton protein RodZ [Vibrio vulnificus]ELA3112691.1 cytoskeleton protein RodZ [Vibrio vulnificus]ELB7530428.1 cytoskeleton protein RodZ [Vibrio vulnificus]ELC9573485.1 cytoskeleton protein RodZ [Vibrio vulnificus]ELK2278537.1 cytoskeleton protein RodZ [Vibrio vulnificus]